MKTQISKVREAIKLDETPKQTEVKPFLNTPLEITRTKLRLMNMVDENIIVTDAKQYIKQDCE